MRLLTSASLILVLVPGCYCSHLPDRYTFGDDAAQEHPDGGTDAASSPDTGPDDAGPEDGGTPCTTCGADCVDTTRDPLHCGACDSPCTAPENATATCEESACGFACNAGYVRVLGECVELAAPRPVSPLSTATVTSRRPTLRWELPVRTDGARVELCEDRACSSVLRTIDASGASVRVPEELPVGVVFWRLFSLADGVSGLSPSPTWQLYVPARSADDDADISWGTVLDINGDGFADIAVGAPSLGTPTNAATHIYYGTPSGLGTSPETLRGPTGMNEELGRSVASAGDVNGDGFADVIVGAPGANSMDGAAFVFLGGAGTLEERRQTLRPPVGGSSRNFGLSVASAGDVNGDGFADVIVGAPGASGGAAFVFVGGPSGLNPSPHASLTEPAGLGGEFGWSVASAGDANGDGFADVVVGDPRVTSNAGGAYVFYGGASGLRPIDPARRASFAGAGTERFGWSVAGTDLDGDGFADLVVGVPSAGSGAGATRIYRGGIGGPSPSSLVTLTGSAGHYFGTVVGAANDIDGDGFADLVVGSPEADSGAGIVTVFRGGPTGVSPTDSARRWTLMAPVSGGFGVSVGSADIDGDTFADLVVGAPGASGNRGAVFVFRGASSGVDFSRRQTIDAPTTSAGFFGRSVGG